MMVGLQGAGKTTTTAKLAGYMKSSTASGPAAACDVYRPAAIEQLVVGGQLGLPVYEEGQGDPSKSPKTPSAMPATTATIWSFWIPPGRLHVDEALMDELKRMKAAVRPATILWWWTP